MIQIDNPQLYAESLRTLQAFRKGGYDGRLVQIFLACKYYGGLIPRIGDPQGLGMGALQRLLDELYERPDRRPNASVVSLFSNNHLFPTGAANNWRNNINFQKGYGCYATPAELNDPVFRGQPRTLCPHLVPATAGVLRHARCDYEPSAEYRREDHPKVFRIDPGSREIYVYDPNDIGHYSPLILNRKGERIPLPALIVVLYFDSRVAGGRTQVDVADFLLDFDFSPAEAAHYFDGDQQSPANAALTAMFPALSWTPIGAPAGIAAAAAQLPGAPVPPAGALAGAIVTQPTAPPAGSHWWDAEQAVRQVLENDGWTVADVSRMRAGYDLRACKAGVTLHIEVKSSVGRCAPQFTANELAAAKRLKKSYVLAVVENFSPTAAVSVLWVKDPARLPFGPRQVTVHSLPRSQWLPKAQGLIP